METRREPLSGLPYDEDDATMAHRAGLDELPEAQYRVVVYGPSDEIVFDRLYVGADELPAELRARVDGT